MSNANIEMYTDASGSVSLGAYFQGSWCAEQWPKEWKRKGHCSNLVLLELFPILVALFIWEDRFRNKRVRFFLDNLGVVQVVNKQMVSFPPVVLLLRQLVLK